MPEMNSVIVGTRYRGAPAIDAAARMRVGAKVQLEREPGNPRDRNAVACYFLGQHVGFIPRALNTSLARAMDLGARPTALIVQIPLFVGRRMTREPLLSISWELA